MKPGWQHVKEAITTDQKNLTDDPHIHEQEKQELKSNDSLIPKQTPKPGPPVGKKDHGTDAPAKK